MYSRNDPFDLAVFRNVMPRCRLRQPLVLSLVSMLWLSLCLLVRLTACRLVRGQCSFVCPIRCRTPVLAHLLHVPLIVRLIILVRPRGTMACLLSCLNVLSSLVVPTLCSPCPALELTTTVSIRLRLCSSCYYVFSCWYCYWTPLLVCWLRFGWL